MKNILGLVLMLVACSCFARGGGGHASGGHTSAQVSAHAEGEAHAVAEGHESAESHEAVEAPSESMRFSFAPASPRVSTHAAVASSSASDVVASDATASSDDVTNSDIYRSGLYSLWGAVASWCALGIFLSMRRKQHQS